MTHVVGCCCWLLLLLLLLLFVVAAALFGLFAAMCALFLLVCDSIHLVRVTYSVQFDSFGFIAFTGE